MPAFFGLLTALGPAATGATLAIASPHPAPGPTHVHASREVCAYVLTVFESGALLTGTCEGPIATWEWQPLPGSGRGPRAPGPPRPALVRVTGAHGPEREPAAESPAGRHAMGEAMPEVPHALGELSDARAGERSAGGGRSAGGARAGHAEAARTGYAEASGLSTSPVWGIHVQAGRPESGDLRVDLAGPAGVLAGLLGDVGTGTREAEGAGTRPDKAKGAGARGAKAKSGGARGAEVKRAGARGVKAKGGGARAVNAKTGDGGGGEESEPKAREGGGKKASGARRLLPGQTAVAAALRQLGTPFSWGGGSAAGPTKGIGRGAGISGFDCSGLTLHAWAKAGIRLGHYTGTQFRQGRRIARSDLRAGDLVFFGGGADDPTHVGLYLRDGVMIHAPKTGDVVKKTNFANSPYFQTRYRGAVRPIR